MTYEHGYAEGYEDGLKDASAKTASVEIRITPTQLSVLQTYQYGSESLDNAMEYGVAFGGRSLFIPDDPWAIYYIGQFVGMREDIARDNLYDGYLSKKERYEAKAMIDLADRLRAAGLSTEPTRPEPHESQ